MFAHVPGILLGEERKGGEDKGEGEGGAEAGTEAEGGDNDAVTVAGAFNKASVRMDAFEETLDHELGSKEDVDRKAIEFCMLSTKASRKRLALKLERLPRGRTDLASMYSRLLATLAPHYAEVAEHVVSSVQGAFSAGTGHKGENLGLQGVEARISNARYLGELTKFGLMPPSEALRQLERLLRDFSGQNIDTACSLLEACGRFLLLSPLGAQRAAGLVDSFQKLAKHKNLEARLAAMVESALLATKPKARNARQMIKHTRIHHSHRV